MIGLLQRPVTLRLLKGLLQLLSAGRYGFLEPPVVEQYSQYQTAQQATRGGHQ